MVQATLKVGFLLQHGIIELRKAGISEAQTDATQLLCSSLGLSRTSLYLAADKDASIDSSQRYLEFLARRIKREPLAYILEEREFWSLPFRVTPAVLIPRPETEFLLETVLARRNSDHSELKICDLCCGSGVIAVVLALELRQQVTAVELSSEAIGVARENCLRHEVSDRVSLIQADLFTGFREEKPFSLIVTNPPYVRSEDIVSGLEPEVACHEPRIALDGGLTGLDLVIRIKNGLADMLTYGGDFFMEIGADQGQAIQSMFLEQGGEQVYESVALYTDYSGRDRVIHIRRKGL